ncbi:hypothetical protein [Umezawaea tangerina]|uniref:Cobalt transporter subunit CbtB n=1 Tax=Umezawaea tangerina TaxID=84725 RepID=A0A2T0TM21_9PSEU|nr:hypothetical protein [Umezawaea tangerina]PRY46699.1 hypothetical protein CLV43_101979 [Umezawaea tangerina]
MAHVGRAAAVIPLVGAVATAVALTGAAFFTVAQTGCHEAGHFEQHGGVLQFVGGCVSGQELPAVPKVENTQYPQQGDNLLKP